MPGHVVTARDQGRCLCSCGERQAPPDPRPRTTAEKRAAARAGEQWREEHLAAAWPILVPKERGESLPAYATRLADELEQASRAQASLDHGSIAECETIPALTPEQEAADDRVVVLEHQLDAVMARLAAAH